MKTTLPRSFYVPTTVQVNTETPPGTNLLLHTYTTSRGTFGLVAFQGKQSKPFVNTYYRSEALRDAARDQLVQNALNAAHDKAHRAATRSTEATAFIQTIKVGDIWSCSWGYDQTNVDFYVVVKITSKMVHLREIGARSTGESSVTPDPTMFVSEEVHARKVVHGGCSLESYQWVSPFQGGSTYQTPANAGH